MELDKFFVKPQQTTPTTTTPTTGLDSFFVGESVIAEELPQEVSTPQKGYFGRVFSQYQRAGEDIVSGIEKSAEQISSGARQGNIAGFGDVLGGMARAGIRTVGGVAGAAFAPIMEAPGIKQVTEKVAETVMSAPIAQDVVESVTKVAAQHPEAAKDVQNIIDIVTLGGGSVAEKPVMTEARLLGKDLYRGTEAMLKPTEEAVQKKVVTLFQKSIKPTAKQTTAQATKYENNILESLRTIKANADNLNIEDATGEIIEGRVPQTLREFEQAVNQTESIIFRQYDDIAKQAGKAGAVIDAKPIAEEVLKVSQNKALQLTNPEVVKYAETWAERLNSFDTLDAQTTQEVIKMMNNNLKSFYNNPTYEAASKASIDAGIVNNLRAALDKSIENATGAEYQALKNQYGALKAIEKDVVRASMREGRKNTRGLLDYTDMMTNGQMVSGILSLNPAMFTKGAVERGFKEYIKFLNDPNRAVSNMFDVIDVDTATKYVPESATMKFIEKQPIGMSIKTVSKQSDDLLAEAKKYKTAEEFVESQMSRGDGMQHRPAFTKATAADVSQKASGFGMPDFYKNPKMYGTGDTKADNESIQALLKVKDKPDAEITIYRASPKNELREGDWVTLSKEYARGESLAENTPVHSFKVKAKDIQFAGDSINEFGYFPSSKIDELTDVWKKATNNGVDIEDPYVTYLKKNSSRYKTVNDWTSGMKASGKTRAQLEDIWNKANATNSSKPIQQK